MSGNPGFLGVPEVALDDGEHKRRLARAINSLLQGKMNAVTTLTLTAGATTSTITDARITNNSFIGFTPTTANAAAELGNGTLYVSNRMSGTGNTIGNATITHANNAQVDRTFIVLIIG
jgi:hypothetical protein